MEVIIYVVILALAILWAANEDKKRNNAYSDKEYTLSQGGPSNTSSLSRRLCCGRCGSDDINISINQFTQQSVSKTKHQKRSIADRAAYKTGRGVMNMATMGMWGVFTPKRGKYKDVTKTTTNVVNQKIAICQSCGNSWNVR